MFDFIALMWINRRITEDKIANYVRAGYITQAQGDMILATPQKEI